MLTNYFNILKAYLTLLTRDLPTFILGIILPGVVILGYLVVLYKSQKKHYKG